MISAALALTLGGATAQPLGDYPPPPGPYPFADAAAPTGSGSTPGPGAASDRPFARPNDADNRFAPRIEMPASGGPAPSPFVGRGSGAAGPDAAAAPAPSRPSAVFRPADDLPR